MLDSAGVVGVCDVLAGDSSCQAASIESHPSTTGGTGEAIGVGCVVAGAETEIWLGPLLGLVGGLRLTRGGLGVRAGGLGFGTGGVGELG